MQSENRFLDDVARVANGLVGTAAGVAREGEAALRERVRHLVREPDAVTREEFEAVRELAVNARAEADRLRARVDALEAARGGDAPA